MGKLYIACSGETPNEAQRLIGGNRNTQLTQHGHEQAHALAQCFITQGLVTHAVYCSPITSAHETAKIICHALNIREPRVLGPLIERNCGTLTGRSIDAIEQLDDSNLLKVDGHTYFFSAPQAESLESLLKRAQQILQSLSELCPKGLVLLVTHGQLCQMLYAAYYDLPWKDALMDFRLGNGELAVLDHDHDAKTPLVISRNQPGL